MIKQTLTREGLSSTGSKHGLMIESDGLDTRFVVTGANGKRHAAVGLTLEDTKEIVRWLEDRMKDARDEFI